MLRYTTHYIILLSLFLFTGCSKSEDETRVAYEKIDRPEKVKPTEDITHVFADIYYSTGLITTSSIIEDNVVLLFNMQSSGKNKMNIAITGTIGSNTVDCTLNNVDLFGSVESPELDYINLASSDKKIDVVWMTATLENGLLNINLKLNYYERPAYLILQAISMQQFEEQLSAISGNYKSEYDFESFYHTVTSTLFSPNLIMLSSNLETHTISICVPNINIFGGLDYQNLIIEDIVPVFSKGVLTIPKQTINLSKEIIVTVTGSIDNNEIKLNMNFINEVSQTWSIRVRSSTEKDKVSEIIQKVTQSYYNTEINVLLSTNQYEFESGNSTSSNTVYNYPVQTINVNNETMNIIFIDVFTKRMILYELIVDATSEGGATFSCDKAYISNDNTLGMREVEGHLTGWLIDNIVEMECVAYLPEGKASSILSWNTDTII